VNDLLLLVAAAISQGKRLSSKRYSVGIYRETEPIQWACVDIHGRPIHAHQQEPRVSIRHSADRVGWSSTITLYTQEDWSAFGAARNFVELVSERAVRRALADARRHA
jgi:hypothetical protein